MRIKKCKICGSDFDALRGNQLTCSAECRKIHNQEYARLNYKKQDKNPGSIAKKKNDYAEIDAEIAAYGSTWGEYSSMTPEQWEKHKHKKFREMVARNNGDIITEKSWIGGNNKANCGQSKVKGYYWQKLTDCQEIKV